MCHKTIGATIHAKSLTSTIYHLRLPPNKAYLRECSFLEICLVTKRSKYIEMENKQALPLLMALLVIRLDLRLLRYRRFRRRALRLLRRLRLRFRRRRRLRLLRLNFRLYQRGLLSAA